MSTSETSVKNLKSMVNELIGELKLNNGVNEVFIKLVDQSDEDVVALELDKTTKKQTTEGDTLLPLDKTTNQTTKCGTLLHCIVHASVESPGNMKYYMQIVDKICDKSVNWFNNYKDKTKKDSERAKHSGEVSGKNEKNREVSQDDVEVVVGKYDENSNYYDAMICLLEELKDESNRNVWELMIERVAVEMIEKLMYLKNVSYKREFEQGCDQLQETFNVSHFVKNDGYDGNIWLPRWLCMEILDVKLPMLLQKTQTQIRFDELMRVKPIKKLTDIYCSINTKIYIAVVFLHLLYISLFSYLGCELIDVRTPELLDQTKTLMFSFGLVEPVLLSIYLFNKLLKMIFIAVHKKCNKAKVTYRKINYVKEIFWYINVLVYDVLLIVVIANIDTEISPTKRNIMSASFLLGWLLTFALANGISQIHFFFKVVLRVMIKDVLKILLVYMIFLLGFSLSLHAQFISSANITTTYETPIHTMYLMFNVMIGMDAAVDENTEMYLETVSASPLISKILYIGYVLCSTIVLLNLLIAMMNTSYSRIQIEHRKEWVFSSVQFGTKVAKYFPKLANVLGLHKIEREKLFKNPKPVPIIKLKLNDISSDKFKYTNNDFRTLELKIEHSETFLKTQILRKYDKMKKLQNETMVCIQDMQAKINTLTTAPSDPKDISSDA